MVTKSPSGIVKPVDRLSLHTSYISPILKSSFLALKDPHWCNAIYDEYNTLVKNGTWIRVPRPFGVNLVRSMWLFKHKFHVDGTLSRYKARLVANDISQQLGVDFDETFSSVVEPATIRTVLSLVVSLDTESKLGPEGVLVQDHILCIAVLQGGYSISRLHGTLDFGLHLYASVTTSLVGYTDADWAGCPSTPSTPPPAPVPKLNNEVLLTLWPRLYGFVVCFVSLRSPLSTTTLVYCDNVSVIYMSVNPVQHQRTKHIEIDIHFVRDMVTAGLVRVLRVPSRYHYIDIFTKGLSSALFEEF
nr:ribonuclease H-like domain-containing protein [Tanacetum cinerariifolium]